MKKIYNIDNSIKSNKFIFITQKKKKSQQKNPDMYKYNLIFNKIKLSELFIIYKE